jgi:hypothetical protein
MPISYSEIKYHLKLANGSTWNFLATKETEPWLERLAATMGLRAGENEGTSTIVLTTRETAGIKQAGGTCISDNQLRKSAWNTIGCHYRNLLDSTEIIYCIDPNQTYENNMFRMWIFSLVSESSYPGALFAMLPWLKKMERAYSSQQAVVQGNQLAVVVYLYHGRPWLTTRFLF